MKKDKILQWMMFLCNPESMKMCEIMKENKDIKEVNKKMKRIIHYMKNTKSWQTKIKKLFLVADWVNINITIWTR